MGTENLHVFGEDGTPEIIGWFDDFEGDHPYRCLSNFHIGEPLRIPIFDGRPFMTGEHAYAAMKARSHEQYERIRRSASPGEAKALGQACSLRPDWELVKYDVMMAVLRNKFTFDREEGDVLVSTGDALLIEGTYWGDQVWGVELDVHDTPHTSPGRNWLGTMLMARRAELKAEALFGYRHNAGDFNARFSSGK